MTERERVLAALRGDVPDRLPWVPRLEFWYRARLRNGTLPVEFQSLSLSEIVDRMGIGYYAVLPDRTESADEYGVVDSALGIFRSTATPFDVILENVERRFTQTGSRTVVEYETPVGTLRTVTVFTDEMLNAGASIPWVAEPAIREPRDFETAGYVFSHLKVVPRPERYLAIQDSVGARGIAVANVSGTAGPVHHIMKQLMKTEQFFYALADYPEKVHALAEQMQPYYDDIQRIAADLPAESVMLGGNYDDGITNPPFFSKYILPCLRGYAETVHQRGKYLMTHTDGENRKLLKLYLDAGFDVADSVCPHPMTRCRLEEYREAFGDRISIWGGIPSVLLCPSSASWEDFRSYVDDVIDRYTGKSHLVLGVSDMVTADADYDRLTYISEKILA